MTWTQIQLTLWYAEGYAIQELGKGKFYVYHKDEGKKGYTRIHAWTVEIRSLENAQEVAECHRKERQGCH